MYTSFPGFLLTLFPPATPPGPLLLLFIMAGGDTVIEKTLALLLNQAGPLLVSITGSKRRGRAHRVTNTAAVSDEGGHLERLTF